MKKLILLKIKECLEIGNFHFVRRDKNTSFIQNLGWTYEEVIEYIYNNLYEEDLVEWDQNEINTNFVDGSIYIFIKNDSIENINYSIYIKIKFISDDNYIVILSFHERER